MRIAFHKVCMNHMTVNSIKYRYLPHLMITDGSGIKLLLVVPKLFSNKLGIRVKTLAGWDRILLLFSVKV